MVKLSLDTNNDDVGELEEALKILEQAIIRRKGTEAVPSAENLVKEATDEATVETPFFKITLKGDDVAETSPTVNELLESESLTEEELQELYKHVPEAQTIEEKKKEAGDRFIEIVEFDEED